MRPIRIINGNVLFSSGLEDASLTLADGQIVAEDAADALVLDARGLVVAPGMVDIHGDAFERQAMPRPGVFFPGDVALLDTDHQLAANGITTAYHAVTLSWEPGLRSVTSGTAMVDAIETLRPRLTVDHRIQLRWETFAAEAVPLCLRVMASDKAPALAFNDHTSMSMRSRDIPVQERAFEQSDQFKTISLEELRKRGDLAGNAKRSGLSLDDYTDLLGKIWAERQAVPGRIADLAAVARGHTVPMLSHDDTQEETRTYYRGLGASIAEFPMSVRVARHARENGDAIVFGAPNVVRGGSHLGSSPNAADMVEQELCDALASDYFYPAMLAAAARLQADRRAPMPAIWDRVSGGPARALGLHDRGEIAVGKRADVVLLDWPKEGTPSVRATISGGKLAFLSGDLVV